LRFFFQAEDGIRDFHVTGVQTCALPIYFKHPEIESWLRARMTSQRILTVQKKSFIDYRGRYVDFPFQKNIHQLDKDELVDCLYRSEERRVGKERRSTEYDEHERKVKHRA